MKLCITTFILTVWCACLHFGFGANTNLKFEINPDMAVEQITKDVEFTCESGEFGQTNERLLLLEVYKDEQNPIAVIRQNDKVNLKAEFANRFHAGGQIDENVGIINLTLSSPLKSDSGEYTCKMFYLDTAGHLHQIKVNSNLQVERYNQPGLFRALLKRLHDLENKKLTNTGTSGVHDTLKELEKESKNHTMNISGLTKKVKALEKKTQHESKLIDNLVHEFTYTSAFSATGQKPILLTTGQDLVFPDIVMKLGLGYDQKTGVFTAPRSGLYHFHLIVTVQCSNCLAQIQLKKNNKILAILRTGDNFFPDQTSTNSLVPLVVGDMVKLVVSGNLGNAEAFTDKSSFFNGYLVKPL